MKQEFGRRTLKGYAFSLDAVFAAMLVAAFLLMMRGYSSGSDIAWTDVNMPRLGSDIIDALYRNGTLQTLDGNAIEAGLNSLLPFNLNMSAKLYVYNADMALAQTVQINDDMPGEYYLGKSRFVIMAGAQVNSLVLVEYKVWFK